jgi:uncharacterized YccA/Bax inhibitor family protein
MTLSGTINKTLILFYCLPHQPGDLVDDFNGMNLLFQQLEAIVGLILVIISAFKPHSLFSPGYALFEGLFIGGVSAILKRCILV